MKKIVFSVMFLLLFCSLASAFSFANLVGYVSMNNAPSAYLVTPKNDAVAAELIFSWLYKDIEDNPQAQFLLQLDDDWRFESPYNLYGLDESFFKADFPLDEGAYYWRVKVKDAYGWGEFSDWRRFDLDLSLKTCVDGTPFWQCSSNIPKYCDGGVLTRDCMRCGCDINEICQANGLCLSNTCSDGTKYGLCSRYKPKYCQNGDLVEVCSLCGCSEELECNPGGSCFSVKIVIRDQEVPQSKTLLEYVVSFFKGLFGAL